MKNSIKNSIKSFMKNRHGVDVLSRDLTWVILLFSILNLFFKKNVFLWLSTILLFIVIYRTLSKNFSKRYNENRIYTNQRCLFEKKYKRVIKRIKDFRKYKYFTCPNCKLKLRVPRGKKKIVITCNRCKTQFDGKT